MLARFFVHFASGDLFAELQISSGDLFVKLQILSEDLTKVQKISINSIDFFGKVC